jgi:hypothetical protein
MDILTSFQEQLLMIKPVALLDLQIFFLDFA